MKQLLSLLLLFLLATGVIHAQTAADKSTLSRPTVVIDGKVSDEITLNGLKPDDIASISILKGPSAFELYGQLGNNGLLVVTTKSVQPSIDLATKSESSKLIIRGNASGLYQPLYVLNGSIVDADDVHTLKPSTVENITILKDASAVALYGPEAHKGVLIITTKKEDPIRK